MTPGGAFVPDAEVYSTPPVFSCEKPSLKYRRSPYIYYNLGLRGCIDVTERNRRDL